MSATVTDLFAGAGGSSTGADVSSNHYKVVS